MKVTSGIGGWAGAHACSIDEHLPGFLGHLQRCNSSRRQIVFAGLSNMTRTVPSDLTAAKEAGHWLMFASGREIITKCFGTDPPGFRKALAKSGASPKPKSFYRRLHKAFLEPGSNSCGRILQFRKTIQPDDVTKLINLPPFARSCAILDVIDTQADAEQLSLELDVIRKVCPSVSEKVLAQSLIAHAKMSDLSDFFENWLKRAEIFPDPPIPGAEPLIPLRTGREMCRVSRQYDNCLDTRIVNVIAGSRYYYEWTQKPNAVVELSNNQPIGWRISEILCRNNRKPASATTRKIEDALAVHNVLNRSCWRKNFIWFDID